MEDFKNYWWMAITIPAIAFLIYILASKGRTQHCGVRYTRKKLFQFLRRKSMKGIAILSIIFGGGVIAVWFILYPVWGISRLITGIVWLKLGLGWLIKEHVKK